MISKYCKIKKKNNNKCNKTTLSFQSFRTQDGIKAGRCTNN